MSPGRLLWSLGGNSFSIAGIEVVEVELNKFFCPQMRKRSLRVHVYVRVSLNAACVRYCTSASPRRLFIGFVCSDWYDGLEF